MRCQGVSHVVAAHRRTRALAVRKHTGAVNGSARTLREEYRKAPPPARQRVNLVCSRDAARPYDTRMPTYTALSGMPEMEYASENGMVEIFHVRVESPITPVPVAYVLPASSTPES